MPTNLSDAKVKALRPGTSAYFEWDSQAVGLGVKVTPPGRKIWVLQLKFPGQAVQSKRTLGHYPGITVHEARGLARQWREGVKVGTDPKEVEADRRRAAERAAIDTFGKVAEAYIAERTNRRAEKDAKAIRRHLVKAWGDRPVSAITPRDIRELVGPLAKRAPHSADETWGHAVLIFKYAVHHELISTSPCASLDKRLLFAGQKLAPRERVLSDGEVAALWCVTGSLGYPEGHVYRWLLLTGCRLNEAARARWTEFDANVWTIPPERFKAGSSHTLPLTEAMRDLLASIPRRGPWVFSHDGELAMNGFSKLKEKVDRLMGDKATGPWVNHDLRRTVRTNLSALGIADHVAEKVIGHGRKGIQRVYDQHRYLSEIRQALIAWNDRVAAMIIG